MYSDAHPSCLCLTQIERHTYNMLQCHPHPGEFTDRSRPLHCSYFMGLQRKQGVPVNEGEHFDIRLTVEEFKHTVNMYSLWKVGMEIHVTHVKRRNIPSFVFPGGIRPSRPSKATWDSRRSSGEKSSESKGVSDGLDDGRKRKRIDDNVANTIKRSSSAGSSLNGEVNEGSPSVGNVSVGGGLASANVIGEPREVKTESKITDIIDNSKSLSGNLAQNGELNPQSKDFSATNDAE